MPGRAPTGWRSSPTASRCCATAASCSRTWATTTAACSSCSATGRSTPWLLRVDGVDLPPTNFVIEDGAGRFWVTVSTRLKPRALGYRRSCNDGFIVRVDAARRGHRRRRPGLHQRGRRAPGGQWLYVNETFSRRLSRFALRDDGSLGAKEVVTEFGPGTFPDGLAFDEEGHAWVVSIVSNRLIRVAPDGAPDALARRRRRRAPGLGRGRLRGRRRWAGRTSTAHPAASLRNISSIAFAGADRRTAVLGCLLGDRLATLRLPVAGVAPTHWDYTMNAAGREHRRPRWSTRPMRRSAAASSTTSGRPAIARSSRRWRWRWA